MVQFHGAYRKLFVEIWRYQWYFTFMESPPKIPPKHTNAMKSLYNSVFSCVFLHTSQSSVLVPVWSTLAFLLLSPSWFPPRVVFFLSSLTNLYLTLMFSLFPLLLTYILPWCFLPFAFGCCLGFGCLVLCVPPFLFWIGVFFKKLTSRENSYHFYF
jgi:hypothetical protein